MPILAVFADNLPRPFKYFIIPSGDIGDARAFAKNLYRLFNFPVDVLAPGVLSPNSSEYQKDYDFSNLPAIEKLPLVELSYIRIGHLGKPGRYVKLIQELDRITVESWNAGEFTTKEYRAHIAAINPPMDWQTFGPFWDDWNRDPPIMLGSYWVKTQGGARLKITVGKPPHMIWEQDGGNLLGVQYGSYFEVGNGKYESERARDPGTFSYGDSSQGISYNVGDGITIEDPADQYLYDDTPVWHACARAIYGIGTPYIDEYGVKAWPDKGFSDWVEINMGERPPADDLPEERLFVPEIGTPEGCLGPANSDEVQWQADPERLQGSVTIRPKWLPASAIVLSFDVDKKQYGGYIRTEGGEMPAGIMKWIYGNGCFDVTFGGDVGEKPGWGIDFGTGGTGLPPIDIPSFDKKGTGKPRKPGKPTGREPGA